MTTQQEKSHDDGSPTPDWRLLSYDSETHTWDLQDGRLFYITSGAQSAIAALGNALRAAESLDDPGLYHRLEAIVVALRAIAAGLPAGEQG
jgi:hypothetical protein